MLSSVFPGKYFPLKSFQCPASAPKEEVAEFSLYSRPSLVCTSGQFALQAIEEITLLLHAVPILLLHTGHQPGSYESLTQAEVPPDVTWAQASLSVCGSFIQNHLEEVSQARLLVLPFMMLIWGSGTYPEY